MVAFSVGKCSLCWGDLDGFSITRSLLAPEAVCLSVIASLIPSQIVCFSLIASLN
jgi:hypothetical protein